MRIDKIKTGSEFEWIFLSVSIPLALVGLISLSSCSKKEKDLTSQPADSSHQVDHQTQPDLNLKPSFGEQPLQQKKQALQLDELSNQKLPPVHNCFRIAFQHKAVSTHGSDESCSHHKNLIKIDRAGIDSKSLCVRVDGIPISHQLTKNKIILGALAGPRSKITVDYCLRGSSCNEDCVVPRDRFLDALGADPHTLVQHVKWDPNDKSESSDITKEIDPEIMKEMREAGEEEVFEGWVASPEMKGCKPQGV